MKRLVLFGVFICLCGAFCAPSQACTTAIISAEKSGTGRPILWKHRDTRDFYNHIEHARGEKYSYTALIDTRDTLREDVWAGANEKGFAIANNVSYNMSPKEFPNLPNEGIVMKRALGVCATVDEFEAFIAAMPVPKGLNTNYAVIDAQGGAAYFEVGDDRYVRFDVSDAPEGYLLRTNFSFAGRPDEGKGYIRYEAAEKLFAEHKGGYTPDWILSDVSRSFYHSLLGRDLKDMKDKEFGNGFAIDEDYIPRYTTVASVVIEGVNPGEDPRGTMMWSAIGYSPCAYAVPVWVGAGSEIPQCLSSVDNALAPANEFAMELKARVFPIVRGSGEKYLDYVTLRKEILPFVEKAEDVEFAEGEKLKRQMAEDGFDIEAIKAFNASADKRFLDFKTTLR